MGINVLIVRTKLGLLKFFQKSRHFIYHLHVYSNWTFECSWEKLVNIMWIFVSKYGSVDAVFRIAHDTVLPGE